MVVPRRSSAVRSSDREIRLLDLLPGERDDPIRCATRVISLDQHPEFETVSYVWGDRKGEMAIEVSGQPISITNNLYAGLLQLRHVKEGRTLWIDQICINQWDLEEKAAQVALMRDIYRQCTQCVTWMGEQIRDGREVPIRDAKAVFDFLRQVAVARVTPLSDLPVLFEQSDRGLAVRKAFEAFSMYGNPWWSRIWTVQEAIIPSSGILMWGPLSVSRKDVLAAARHLRDLSNLPFLPEGFTRYRHTYTELLRRLLYPVHGFNHSKTDNALNLLMRWRHREFTDPRDKVYALLGMIKPSAVPNAQSCDYAIAVPTLFAQVTLDLINHEGSLRPLLGACEMPQQSPGIASWSIDFACVNRIGKRQLRWWNHSHRYRVFSACGENGLALPATSDNQILALQGVHVDEVIGTVELLRVNAQDPIDLHQLSEPVRNCLQLLKQHRLPNEATAVYEDGFTWESAFCRTLVGDLIMDELPVDRIATYGRARLEADFEELFNKLNITLDHKLKLDFAVDLNPPSPGYSPTSPTYPPAGSIYTSSSSAQSENFATDSPTSPIHPGNVWVTEGPDSKEQDSGVNDASPGPVIRALKMPNKSKSTESIWDHDNVSQHSHVSGKPSERNSPVISLDSANNVPFSRDPSSPAIIFEENSVKALNNDPRTASAHDQASRSPRKSDASYGSHFSAYSETHWIALPTERDPYLSSATDNRRTSRIRQLRDEFLANEGAMPSSLDRPEPDSFTNLHESLIGMMENQTFFITRSGYIGIGPAQTRDGDQVWVFNGGNVPFVMRKLEAEKMECLQLTLTGDAYVHGIMDGEATIDGSLVQTVHIR
jgi:hypothetical protein